MWTTNSEDLDSYKDALALVEHADAAHMPSCTEPIAYGSNTHFHDGDKMKVEPAVSAEAMDNVFDHAKRVFEGTGQKTVLHRFIAPLGPHKTPFYFNWSNTPIAEKAWFNDRSQMGLFDVNPMFDPAKKTHANSMHNGGMKKAFEKITGCMGDLLVTTLNKINDRFVGRIGRYGYASDKAVHFEEDSAAEGTRTIKHQKNWSISDCKIHGDNPVSLLETQKFAAGCPTLEQDNKKDTANNIGSLYEVGLKLAMGHDKKSDPWFCVAMGPIAEVPFLEVDDMSRSGRAPIVHIADDRRSLNYIDHHGMAKSIAELTRNQYLPIDTKLTTSPLTYLDVFEQDTLIDFTQNEWASCIPYRVGEDVVQVIEVVRDNEVKMMLELKQIPDDGTVSRGVCFAIQGTTRLINTNPLAFESDKLGDAKISQYGPLNQRNNVYDHLLDSQNRYPDSIKKSRKVDYKNLKKFMDQEPAFTQKQWDSFQNQCREMGGSDGHLRIQRAVGMHTRAYAMPTDELLLNDTKDQMITQPTLVSGSSPPVPPWWYVGATFREIVEFCFRIEWDALPQPRPGGGVGGGGGKQKKRHVTEIDDACDEDEEDDEDEGGDDHELLLVEAAGSSRKRQAPARLASTNLPAPIRRAPTKKASSAKKTSAAAAKRLKTNFDKFEATFQAHKQALAAITEAQTDALAVTSSFASLESEWRAIAHDIKKL